jgi:CheY-like chemotaxis protein
MPRPRTPPPPTWKGEGTLLLVDDEQSVRGVTASMAESFGFAVVVAADGEEALRLFREHADKIHVVLLDLTMPRMGGEETLKELRKLQPNVPIVLMSGYSELDARGRFPEEGPTDYLQKPFRRAELMSVLRKATATT